LPVSVVVECALVPQISNDLKTWSGRVTSVLIGFSVGVTRVSLVLDGWPRVWFPSSVCILWFRFI